jgi:hypothetical protein
VTSNGADSLNRYRVGHQGGVRDDPHHPAVHADDEVVQPSRVAAGEQQRDRREEHEQPDQAAGEGIGLPHVPGGPVAMQAGLVRLSIESSRRLRRLSGRAWWAEGQRGRRTEAHDGDVGLGLLTASGQPMTFAPKPVRVVLAAR